MFCVALLLLLAAGCVKCEELTQPASVTVQPGQRLTITCQVSYSVSDYYTAWIRQPAGKGLEWIGSARAGSTSYYKDSLKNKFSIDLESESILNLFFSNKTVTLNGQNVQPEDSAVYYCARWSGDYFDYWGKGTTVTVTSATQTAPTVFPLMQCGSATGATVTLGCLATGFTPSALTYTWSQNGNALTDFIQYPPVQKGNFYTGISQIQVRTQDWQAGKTFKCLATHAAGNGQAVMVIKPVNPVLPTVDVLASSDEEKDATFSCFVKDFSPKTHEVTWLKNEAEVPNKIYEIKTVTEERKEPNGTLYSSASFLKVPSSEWTVGTTFTCLFRGEGENKVPVFVNSSVTHERSCPGTGCDRADVEMEIIHPTTEDMFSKKKGTVVCRVKVNRPSVTRIYWKDQDGNEMAGSSVTPVNGKTISAPLDITYEEWSRGVKRVCFAEHEDWFEPFEKIYERKIGGQAQRPSVFMMPPVEHTRKGKVTLTCFVKDFYPKDVLVTWLVDDEEADSTYKYHTTNPVNNGETYSAYGQLSISLDQWKENDVVYSCVVHHESVENTTKAIVRSIGYKTFEKNNLINLSMNVPDTCKA